MGPEAAGGPVTGHAALRLFGDDDASTEREHRSLPMLTGITTAPELRGKRFGLTTDSNSRTETESLTHGRLPRRTPRAQAATEQRARGPELETPEPASATLGALQALEACATGVLTQTSRVWGQLNKALNQIR